DASATHLDVYEAVAGLNGNGDDAAFADIGKLAERGLFYRAALRRKEQFSRLLPGCVLFVRAAFGHNPDQSGDGFAVLQLQDIGDAPAFGGASHVGDFVDPLDVSAPGVGEEHQEIVRAGGKEVLDKIRILLAGPLAGRHADHSLAAAPLGAVGTDVGAFDEPV